MYTFLIDSLATLMIDSLNGLTMYIVLGFILFYIFTALMGFYTAVGLCCSKLFCLGPFHLQIKKCKSNNNSKDGNVVDHSS